ncbi:uncharacterized protein ARMOST_17969 [Armillaria ostoyae]|uniref:F-box domain-containing protein n=1 Tax=Armillaria ostoyae TaxID=47428 RepID=A0A284S0G9_ARMOS|nr:uncharacterized protein ARMOST_17969 [Armillaria ostoyae]
MEDYFEVLLDDDVYSWPSTILCEKCGRSLPSSTNPTLSFFELFQNLREGYSPADSEVESISDVQLQIIKEVSAYDAEILRLEITLEELYRDRDRLRTYAKYHSALLSPVRRLPYDILLQIFKDVQVCEEQYKIHPPGSYLRLGLVCKRWREITLDSPSLWSTIFIPLRPLPWLTPRWNALQKIVQIQQLRSQETPLTLMYQTYEVDTGDQAFDLIIQDLSAQRHRVRQVECSLNAVSVLGNGNDMLAAAEGLVIIGYEGVQSPNNYTLNLPDLLSLTIRDHVPLRRIDLPRHIHTLNLVLRRDDFAAAMNSLPGMHSLRNFTIEARGVWNVIGNVNVCLNTVTSFTCRNFHPSRENSSFFLRRIQVPSLTHLTIVGGSLQLDAIKALLERSNPPLKNLEIITNVNTDTVNLSKFVTILQVVPDLTTLAIHEQRSGVLITASLLRELTFDGHNIPLLPKLEHLELVSGTPWTDVEGAIMQLIRSRHGGSTNYRGRRTDTPLKSVALNWSVLCTKPVFQEMRSTGLRIWEILPAQRIIR